MFSNKRKGSATCVQGGWSARHLKSGIAWILAFMLIWMPVGSAQGLTYREMDQARPGNPVITQQRQLSSGIVQESWQSVNRAGRPVAYQAFTVQPSDPQTRALVWSGYSVPDRNTVSDMVQQARAQGYTVVAAVNGDFFNTDTGAPIGIVVQRGELISSDGAYAFAIGFHPDGTTRVGQPALQYLLTRNGMPAGSFTLNKQQTNTGIHAYNAAYGVRAGSTQVGVDVVIQTVSPRFSIGGFVEGTVLEVRQDAQATPIGANQVVLSARAGTPEFETLSTFVPGDAVRLDVKDPSGQWTGIAEAVGGLHRLLANGIPVADLSQTNVNPATMVGRKPDGSIVLIQTDGRQAAWSNGISYAEGATLMLGMGCTDAIVLDGGGSSTAVARMPGEVIPALVNRPSDGAQRKVSNALLLVSNAVPSLQPDPLTGMQSAEAASLLHLYPGKQYLLPGATVSWKVLASDSGYHAAKLPGGLILSSTGGVFDATGKMVVTGATGLHTVSAVAGSAVGEASFIIPERLTEIRLSATSVVLASGESIDLNAVGYLETVEVKGVDASFVWSLDPAVGTITPDGVLTAAGEPGATGQLVVSWNSTQTQIPVSIAREPIPIEEFETTPVWVASGIKAKGAAARTFTDTDLAPFGDGLLRVWYDFRPQSGEDAGTSGVMAGPAAPGTPAGGTTMMPIPLEGTPTSIGMWVYGNNSRYWLRGRLMDATGREVDLDYTPEYKAAAGTGGIDWNGWRHVEAAIPAGLVAPYQLTVPIRLMCPQEELKGTGTILVDRMRSLYGVRNDDLVPPDIAAVWPPENGAVASGAITLSSRSYEAPGGSGFNPGRTRLMVDGVLMPTPEVTWDPDGAMRVSASLGAEVPLAAGGHVVSLRVEDLFGNKTTRTWSFEVKTPSPRLSLSVPKQVSSGEVFDAVVNLAVPNPLKALDVTFKWDPTLMVPVDMNPQAAGIQLGTEKYVADAQAGVNEADAATGTWRFSVSALNSTIKDSERKMLTLRFRALTTAVGDASVSAVGAQMQVANVPVPQRVSLSGGPIQIKPAFHLDVRDPVEGGTVHLTVADRHGSLVSGATIFLAGAGAFAQTDGYGTASVALPKSLTAGTKISFQAVRNGLSSPFWTGVVGEAAKGANPRAVTVSPISQPGGMAVHWLSTAATGTHVQVVEQARYQGMMPADATKAVATTVKTTIADPVTGAGLYEHKAVFYGLKSGTAYQWRITDGANGHGKTGNFSTPVSSAGETFKFGFLTDPQALNAAGYIPFRGAVRRLLGQAPDLSFLIFGGDIVDNGSKTSQWWGFFETAGAWLESIPFLTIPGNHEYKDDASLNGYSSFVGMPATGPSGMGERCYTVLNGDARFYMLDTQDDLDKQLAWLRTERAASGAIWNIVVMHRGIYGGFYDEADFRAKAAPVFDEIGIDLVLSGHDHTWQRTTMKAGRKVKPGEGTTYVTGGSSGGKFYDAPSRAWTEVSYDGNTPSMTVITVSSNRLEVVGTHVEKNLTVQHDAFVIHKP